MLSELRINNLGVVAAAVLNFGAGLNVLTGETGAGKTMILNALTQTLGEKSDTKLVRVGEAKCWIESDWDLSEYQGNVLSKYEDMSDSSELTLGKVIEASGKSRPTINGLTSNLNTISEISDHLIRIFGQADQQYLTKATWQLSALDAMGDKSYKKVLSDYQNCFLEYQKIQAELNDLRKLAEKWESEQRRIAVDLAEFDEISPKPDEDDQILLQIKNSESVEQLREIINEIQGFFEDRGVGGINHQINSLLKAIAKLDEFSEFYTALQGVPDHLNELERKVIQHLSDDQSGASLEDLFARKALIQSLIRKHGMPLSEIIDKMNRERDMLEGAADPASEVERLTSISSNLAIQLTKLANELTKSRIVLGQKLDKLVSTELTGLKMAGSKFITEVVGLKAGALEISGLKLDRSGADQVIFNITHGSSAAARPIAKAASGGELSRIMLALQVVLPAENPDLTYVFDEVDAGIGGETAIEVGRRLAKLAKSNQVLVVTHLPQVAAFADVHFRITGDLASGLKTSDVAQLAGVDRVAEIARMLGGMQDSAAALSHAEELLSLNR